MKYLIILLPLLLICGCSSQYAVDPPLEGETSAAQESLKTSPQAIEDEGEKSEQESEVGTSEPSGYGPAEYEPEAGTQSTNPQGTMNDPGNAGVDGLNYNQPGNLP